MSFKKATKLKAKLRLALGGIAGSGKTYSALSTTHEMSKLMREAKLGEGRIAVIDSERGSASLYADRFDFDVSELTTFSPLSYVEKIHEAEEAGYDFIVVDSLSHAWAGTDGALDQKDQIAERDQRSNSYTAWRSVTPKHNALIDAMLQSKAHVIATMRQKMEYVQEKDEKGKTTIRKVGLQLVQRDQIDFEFTLVGEIEQQFHTMKITKTRCAGIDIGDIFEKPGETFARKVWTWLMSGADMPARVVAPAPALAPTATIAGALDAAFASWLASLSAATTLPELDLAASGPGRPAKGTPEHARATETYLACKAAIEKRSAVPQAGAA